MASKFNIQPATGRKRHLLGFFRAQLIFIVIIALLPSAIAAGADISYGWNDPNIFNTAFLSLFGALLALMLFRRAELFPGVGVTANVLPSLFISFGIVIMAIIVFRLDYSRLTLGAGMAILTIALLIIGLASRQQQGQKFYLLKSKETDKLQRIEGVDWHVIDSVDFNPDMDGVIVADLRRDWSEEWERKMTALVLGGHPIYHTKQVYEMITGRVQIEHLSENSLGSLAPSASYQSIKRILDLLLSLAILPILLPAFFVIAVAVRLDSRGPVFFRQERVGYRESVFSVLKFRTMRHQHGGASDNDVEESKTQDGDVRVTKLGGFLRRTRIDELPQIYNVIRGEMSWIGPRPEAVPLSRWYSSELPFYSYRHVVRPGITGWAQVNQGHVTELDAVHDKLHYDFYYIKHFSAWIDLSILIRTSAIIFSGFGAK